MCTPSGAAGHQEYRARWHLSSNPGRGLAQRVATAATATSQEVAGRMGAGHHWWGLALLFQPSFTAWRASRTQHLVATIGAAHKIWTTATNVNCCASPRVGTTGHG